MKRIEKRDILLFFASAIVTALVILLVVSLILTEYNTLKLGFEEAHNIFALNSDGFIINDRKYFLPFDEIYAFLQNDIFKALAVVFLFI